jgi:hypothetical protein
MRPDRAQKSKLGLISTLPSGSPMIAADPQGLASPRSTMQRYLDAITDVKVGQRVRAGLVIRTWDLFGTNGLIRRECSENLARLPRCA